MHHVKLALLLIVLLAVLLLTVRNTETVMIQIAIFTGERFVVTRHTGVSPSIDRLWAHAEADSTPLAAGADSLLPPGIRRELQHDVRRLRAS